jgi:hypothetical protein
MNTSMALLASSITSRSGLRVVTASEAQRVSARAAADQTVIPFQLQRLEERVPQFGSFPESTKLLPRDPWLNDLDLACGHAGIGSIASRPIPPIAVATISSFLDYPPGDSSTRPTASIPRTRGNLTPGEYPLHRTHVSDL